MIYLVWFGVFVVTVMVYLRKVYSRFSKYGVNNLETTPILGNTKNLAMKKWHVAEDLQDLYNAFPNDRFVGRYEMMSPLVVVRDPDLIKQVTVKDYEYFLDHRLMVDEEVDPIFGRNLFCLRGQEWKDMRSTLSPAFTSSKMRGMVPLMMEANEQMIRYIKKKIETSKSGYYDVEGKDLTSRYTNDVIASCAFGIKVNSHEDENNEFYHHGKATTQLGFKRILVYLGYSSFPKLAKKLQLKLIDEVKKVFFLNLFKTAMKERETKNIFRPDMIQLLLQAKKGKLMHDDKVANEDAGFATVEESDVGKRTINRTWSDTDLVAQAVLFFVAGFETVSSAMSFLLYEMAVNPDVQDKLVQECKENEAKNGGKFDYTSVQNLKYLDMVVSELLRLWPPAVGLDRICRKDYNMGKPNDNAKSDYVILKGEPMTIPVWAIHRDPKYYANPNKFDPERFSDENKDKIQPCSYIPFGSGPRNCIGSRFALCEVKVMAYQVLQHFEIIPCEKTPIHAKLSPKGFNLALEGGQWVRLRPRK